MSVVRKKEVAATRLGDALSRLARDGGPVPLQKNGQTVAMILTPEELERLEDERDAALLRAAQAEPKPEPGVRLEDLAAELGVTLRD